MTFEDSVKLCLTRKYADFEGAATRSEYWWFVLFVVIVEVLLDMASHPVAALFGLAMLVPHVAAAVRRLHDTDRSGWWMLLWLVPLLGQVVLVVILAQPGKTPVTPAMPASPA